MHMFDCTRLAAASVNLQLSAAMAPSQRLLVARPAGFRVTVLAGAPAQTGARGLLHLNTTPPTSRLAVASFVVVNGQDLSTTVAEVGTIGVYTVVDSPPGRA